MTTKMDRPTAATGSPRPNDSAATRKHEEAAQDCHDRQHYTPGERSRLQWGPADLILPRLEKFWERGPGSWVACCPAHQDKNPSLSIREASDGKLLLHCFAGCDVPAIVAAIGLELKDLFPPKTDDYGPRRKHHLPPIPWRDVINTSRHHLRVVQMGAARLAAGDELSEADLDALGRAALHVYDVLEGADR